MTTVENDCGEVHYELHASEDDPTPWERFLFRSLVMEEAIAMKGKLESIMHEHNKLRT